MGKDLREARPKNAHERFFIYSSDTSKKEILEHTAKPTGVFRAVGGADAVYTKDEYGNVVETFMKNDTLITTDKIKLKVGDLIFNIYAKEFYIVESWDETGIDMNLEFSTRPAIQRTIRVRGGFDG